MNSGEIFRCDIGHPCTGVVDILAAHSSAQICALFAAIVYATCHKEHKEKGNFPSSHADSEGHVSKYGKLLSRLQPPEKGREVFPGAPSALASGVYQMDPYELSIGMY